MFARVFHIQADIDRIDEGIKTYGEGYVPAAKEQKGFSGALLLGDRKTGKGIYITLWDSEEDATATEQSGFVQEHLAKFVEILTATHAIEGFEVLIQA